MTIRPSAFWPRPDVDSMLVRFFLREHPPVDVPSEELLFRIVRGSFHMRRKQLRQHARGGARRRRSRRSSGWPRRPASTSGAGARRSRSTSSRSSRARPPSSHPDRPGAVETIEEPGARLRVPTPRFVDPLPVQRLDRTPGVTPVRCRLARVRHGFRRGPAFAAVDDPARCVVHRGEAIERRPGTPAPASRPCRTPSRSPTPSIPAASSRRTRPRSRTTPASRSRGGRG